MVPVCVCVWLCRPSVWNGVYSLSTGWTGPSRLFGGGGGRPGDASRRSAPDTNNSLGSKGPGPPPAPPLVSRHHHKMLITPVWPSVSDGAAGAQVARPGGPTRLCLPCQGQRRCRQMWMEVCCRRHHCGTFCCCFSAAMSFVSSCFLFSSFFHILFTVPSSTGEGAERLEGKLLNMFGLQRRPRPKRDTIAVPEFLLDLYRRQTGLDVDTTNLNLQGKLTQTANTVRTFVQDAQEGTHCWSFF